jgi:HK97 family phage major capsid protein
VGAVTNLEVGFEASEFFDQVLQGSILGKMAGLRRVAFDVRMLAATTGASGFWVGQAKPRPLSKTVISGSILRPLTVNAIIVTTAEQLRNPSSIVEAALHRDIMRAATEALDTSFIDVSNTGISGTEPAAITDGATSVAATSDPSTDIAALIAAFEGDLAAAYLVSDPVTLTRLALARDSGGGFLFPDLGPRGGSLLGIPVISSRSSPLDSDGGQLAIVDPTGIAVGFDGIEVTASEHTSLLMADDPADGPGEMVSLFQTNSAAMLAKIYANWERQVPGSVALLTGCQW